VIIVDEKSQTIDGDQLMAIMAQSWKEKERLSGNGIVATIMSNLGLERFLSDIDLSLVRTPVGDRYVVEHMRKNGYNVGGEQSGHIVFSDYSTTGDGLIAALQLLSVVKTWDKPVSEVCKRFEPVPQVLKNVRYKGGDPLSNIHVKEAISEGQSRLANSGRLVIRASGTEPLIRVMGEGDDAGLITNVVDDIVNSLRQAAA